MFYYTLLLQMMIYATNKREHDGNIENSENALSNTNTHTINDLCVIAQKIVEKNNTHNEIYQSIVQKFVKKYILYYRIPLNIKYMLPSNYEPDDIKKLCNEVEKTFINVNNDKYYNFYKKLFIESAQFSLGTIKTLFELHQKLNGNSTECRKALETNLTLFDNFVISINWLNSNQYPDHEICLLYDYDHFHTYYDHINNIMNFLYQYWFNSKTTEDQDIMTNLVKYTQQYYKENDFTSNQKIIENESMEKIREWIDSNNDIEDKAWYKTLVQAAVDHICLYRMMQTKINYLSKPNYTRNQIKTKKKYKITDKQKEFIEKLQLDGIVKDIYKLKFNTMRMHTTETIMEGIALITTFEENINRLIEFTERIEQFLLDRVKEKLKKAIQTSKKITKHTKKRCVIEINKITSDMQLDTEKSLTKIQVKLEEINVFEVFYDKLKNRISYISTNPIRKHKLSSIIKTIKNEDKKDEINALYCTLIPSLNHIINMKQKLDEKNKENESTRQKIEDIIFFTKNIEAGTLRERAAKQIKKNMESRKDIFYGILDDIIETKGMIVETEALVYKILKEMKNKD